MGFFKTFLKNFIFTIFLFLLFMFLCINITDRLLSSDLATFMFWLTISDLYIIQVSGV